MRWLSPPDKVPDDARQGEIIQSHIVEEFQPRPDFLEDADGDFLLLPVQLLVDIAEPGVGIADRLLANLADMQTADLHRQRFRLQAIAVADLAWRFRLEALQILLHPGRIGLAIAPLHVGNDALETFLGFVAPGAVVIDKADLFVARTMQDGLARLFGQVFPGIVHRNLVVPRQGFQGLQIIGR